jgi:branched-chain amino acid transport system permease protein
MLLPLMMTVVGGTGTVLGPIVGALIMYAVFDTAKILVPNYHPIISGLTIILVMLFLPNGLVRVNLSRMGLLNMRRPGKFEGGPPPQPQSTA